MTDDRQGPTPERLRRAGDDHDREVIVTGEGDDRETTTVVRLLDRHPLNYLMNKRVISLDLHSAGLQFYSDWYFARFSGSGVVDPGRVVVDGGRVDLEQDFVLSAASRYRDAVRAIGIMNSWVMTDVVLQETHTLEEYGRMRRGLKDKKDAKLAGITLLVSALENLDYHYHGKRNTRTRHSGAADYRPTEMLPPQEAEA